MTHTKLFRLLAAIAVVVVGAALLAACIPVPQASWGCGSWNSGGNASLSHYGDDGTKMELNTDVFNPSPGMAATICGNNQTFSADVNAPQQGPVQAYPSIKYRYDQSSWVGCCGEPGGSVPLKSVKSWTSSWNVSFDASTNSQAAYDLWFANNCGYLGGQDAMTWVDTTASRGTGGGPIVNAHASVAGRDVTFMRYGPPTQQSGKSETIFKFNTNEPSGSIDLLAVVNALEVTGDLKACDSRGLMVANADFGYEVAGTAGTARFSVNEFHNVITTTDGVQHP